MVISRRFRFYFIFRVVVVLLMFGLSSTLLQRYVVRRLVAAFYPYEDDSDKQNIFDQSKISNYSHQYVEKLKLRIF